MKHCVFRMPVEITEFDWTFAFGSATYEYYDMSHIKLADVMTETDDSVARKLLLAQKHKFSESKEDDGGAAENKDNDAAVPVESQILPQAPVPDEKSADASSGCTLTHKRDKAGQILISWLVTCTEMEYITSVDPTPGILCTCLNYVYLFVTYY